VNHRCTFKKKFTKWKNDKKGPDLTLSLGPRLIFLYFVTNFKPSQKLVGQMHNMWKRNHPLKIGTFYVNISKTKTNGETLYKSVNEKKIDLMFLLNFCWMYVFFSLYVMNFALKFNMRLKLGSEQLFVLISFGVSIAKQNIENWLNLWGRKRLGWQPKDNENIFTLSATYCIYSCEIFLMKQ
jgi:hypothetical protein